MTLRLILTLIILIVPSAKADFCERLIEFNLKQINQRQMYCQDGDAHDVCNANMMKWLQHDCSRNIFASLADQCENNLPKDLNLEELATNINARPFQSISFLCTQYSKELNYVLLSKKSFANENIHNAQIQAAQEVNHLNQLTKNISKCEQENHTQFQIRQCRLQKHQCQKTQKEIDQEIQYYEQQAKQYLDIKKTITDINIEIIRIQTNKKAWKADEQNKSLKNLENQKNILTTLKNNLLIRYPWLEGDTFNHKLSGRNHGTIKEAMLAQWKQQTVEIIQLQNELSNAELCLTSEQRKCDFNQINALLYEINDQASFVPKSKNKNDILSNQELSRSHEMYQCLLEATHIRDDSGNRIQSGVKDVAISAAIGLATGGMATLGRLAVLGTKNTQRAKILPALITGVTVATNVSTSGVLAYHACLQASHLQSTQKNNTCKTQFQLITEKMDQDCFLTQVSIDAATAGVFHQLGERIPQLFEKLKNKNPQSEVNALRYSEKQKLDNKLPQTKEIPTQKIETANPKKSIPPPTKRVPIETKAFQKAQSQWASINKPMPDHVPYYSLGLTDHLSSFSKMMEDKFKKSVNSYHETSRLSLTNNTRRREKEFHINALERGALGAALYHIEHTPNSKSVLFNLDGINFDYFERYFNHQLSMHSNFTNEEIKVLISNKEYFDHVRWFKDGKELSFEELYQIFHKFNPQLFAR